MRYPLILTIASITTISLSCQQVETIQVGENTFVHEKKVYRVIENQVTEIGDLNSDSLFRSEVLFPELQNYKTYELDYIKQGAKAQLKGVYRGDVLYLRMEIYGLNDLYEKYSGGELNLNLLDEYNFYIHSVPIQMHELTRILGFDNKVQFLQYDGKTQMSSEVYRSINSYSVSSSLREKKFGW